MSEAVLVRGSDSARGKIISRAIAVLLLAVGALSYYGFDIPALGVVGCAAAVALWLATDLYSVYNHRRKRWITDTGDGFIVTDRAGQRDWRDEQVAAIAVASKERFSGGELKAVCRRVLLWLDEPAPTELESVIRVEGPDPLAPLLERWLEKLTSHTQTAMAQGGVLPGDGWTLRSNVLSVAMRAATEEVPLDEIAEVGLFDGAVCLWRRGEERASLKLPPEGRNVPILTRILGELLEARGEAQGAETPGAQEGLPSAESQETGLGRVLFERRSRALKTAAAVGTVLSGAVGVGLIFNPDLLALAVGLLVLSGLLLVAAWRIPPSVFRCHATGVFRSGLSGKRQIRYDEVDGFTYGATRHFVNGVYQGTFLALKFTSPGATISYNKQVKNVDEDLENLRDHVAAVIAGRMGEQFSQGQPVVWTPNLTLRPDGIEYAPQGFLGRKERQFLPYSEVTGFDLQEGVFHLWAAGRPKSVVREQVSAPNFFPGFLLLSSVFKPDDDA